MYVWQILLSLEQHWMLLVSRIRREYCVSRGNQIHASSVLGMTWYFVKHRPTLPLPSAILFTKTLVILADVQIVVNTYIILKQSFNESGDDWH